MGYTGLKAYGFFQTFFLLLSFFPAGATTALAGSATGSTALALAGVVAPYSASLTADQKKVVAALFAGNSDSPGKSSTLGRILVAADKIVCRTSNVDIAARSCELTFGNSTRTLKGREANELFATQAMAGVPADGAAGSNFESVAKLSCTLDPRAIAEKRGDGAECSYKADD
jgi:hypothetical protein